MDYDSDVEKCLVCKTVCHRDEVQPYYHPEDHQKGQKDYYPIERIDDSNVVMCIDFNDKRIVHRPIVITDKILVGYTDIVRCREKGTTAFSMANRQPIYEYIDRITDTYEIVPYYAVWIDVNNEYERECVKCECPRCTSGEMESDSKDTQPLLGDTSENLTKFAFAKSFEFLRGCGCTLV